MTGTVRRTAYLTSVEAVSGRYTKPKHAARLKIHLFSRQIVKEVYNRGKFIYMDCGDTAIAITLGMTGNFGLENGKHSRLKFTFSDIGDVYFVDARNFGTVRMITKKELERKLDWLGLDPIESDLDFSYVSTCLTLNTDKTLAEVLMNQKHFAGIGNYLKAEVLWHSRLSPNRIAGTLSAEEVNALKDALMKVPRMSFENQGASIRNYTTPTKEKGKFSELFEVYGKKSDREGNAVIKETTRDKRSTYWAPARQR
jgi:formamidopyrimidine-DNA glycosylase